MMTVLGQRFLERVPNLLQDISDNLQTIAGKKEQPEKVWVVKQESNCDGEYLFNVVVCKDYETARKVMGKEVHTLLTEAKPYLGAFDYILGDKEADDDCPYSWENENDDSFYISVINDDYHELITIDEVEIKK